MGHLDLIIRGHRVVTPDAIGPASIHIQKGVITAVGPYGEIPSGRKVLHADENSVIMPGLVDTHVHINEPGRTGWEGFASATRAAAAGGVTSLFDMPLNNVPATTTLEALQTKLAAAEGQCWVDVGFWGGVVPGNSPQLPRLFDAGVFGFKCFLVHSGVEEFPNVTKADLRIAMPELARIGAVLLVHAELPGPIEKALSAQAKNDHPDPRQYSTYLQSRPREAENEAVALILNLSRETGARAHIVHHCSSDALPVLRQARADGLPVTVETCPHHLCFAAEDIPDGATEFKCSPPVRERENREQLWAALGEGLIDMVVSDHSPCPPELKCPDSGDFMQAWGGISSLQLRLPVMWTQARERGYSIHHLVEWLSRAPARLIGLDQNKGAIAAGFDADLVLWNPEATFPVEPSIIQHRHKLTPYTGRVLSGVVQATFLRGEKVYDNGHFSSGPRGAILKRGSM